MRYAVAQAACGLAAILVLGVTPGCKTPSFGNQMTTRQEVQIGGESAAELEAQYPPVTDPAVVDRVSEVAGRVLLQAAKMRGDITYRVKVLPLDSINSFSLPGGWIYLTQGLVNEIGPNDDMLACVIAHEAAHEALHQSANQIIDAVGRDDLLDMLTEGKYQDLANITLQLDQASHSRDDENQADRYGVKFAADAGYDPKALLAFFDKIENMPAGSAKPEWLATHPLTKNRILHAEDDIRDLQAGKY